MKDPFICWIFGILSGYMLGRLVGIVKTQRKEISETDRMLNDCMGKKAK